MPAGILQWLTYLFLVFSFSPPDLKAVYGDADCVPVYNSDGTFNSLYCTETVVQPCSGLGCDVPAQGNDPNPH